VRQAPRPAGRAAQARGDRHVPQRTCVGCRRTRPRADLLRLAATSDTIRFDARQRLPGRGAYVCPDPDCVDAAARRNGHAVLRALRGGTPEQTVTALDTLRAHLGDTPHAHLKGPSPADGTHHEEQLA